ncbi:hypothetical protein BGZ68_002249 [Mortierella alpina]|nr:hypothetical protein BGZ68_002249 [Mortierella alpina]
MGNFASMVEDISIQIKLETMDSEEISTIKDKLEALKSDDIAEDAVSVRMSLVEMCQNIIAERIIATMRQAVVATVGRSDLTVKDRIDHIISIIEDNCRAITWCLRPPISMFFAELATDERGVSSQVVGDRFRPFGSSDNTTFWHDVKIETSPAGTAITVNTYDITVQGLRGAAGKKTGGPKLSVAQLKAMVAASGVGASLKNPPYHTLATPPNQTLVNPPELNEP